MPPAPWSDEWIDALWKSHVGKCPEGYVHEQSDHLYSHCRTFARAVAAKAMEQAAQTRDRRRWKVNEIKNAKIRSVSIGFEDHGILTCWLNLDYGGSAQGFGGYGFSHRPKDKHIGSPDFADYILGILTTLEVDLWEKLPGTVIRAECAGLNEPIRRIGHALKEQWFDPQSVVGKRR